MRINGIKVSEKIRETGFMPPCHLDLSVTSIYIDTVLPSQSWFSQWTDKIHNTILIVLIEEICSKDLVICLKAQRQEIEDPELKLRIYDGIFDDFYSTSPRSFQHRIAATDIARKRS